MWEPSQGELLPTIFIRQAVFVPTTSFQQDWHAATTWGGRIKLEVYPQFPEIICRSSEEEHHLSIWSPYQSPCSLLLHIWKSAPRPREDRPFSASTQTGGGLSHHPAGTQTEGGLGYHSSLNFYGKPIKPEPNWNMSSSMSESWLKDANISEPNRLGGMQGKEHISLIKLMPLSRRYCPRQVQWRPSSYYPGVFLQWCLSTT